MNDDMKNENNQEQKEKKDTGAYFRKTYVCSGCPWRDNL